MKNPPIGQSQEASRLGQKPEIWGIPPMEQSQEASGLE